MRTILVSAKPEKLNGGIAVWTARYVSRCSAYGIDCALVNTEVMGKRAQQGTAKRSLMDECVRTRRIFKDLKKALNTAPKAQLVHLNTSCGTFGLFRDYMIARQIHKKGIPVITHYHCDIPFWIHNPVNRSCLKKLASLSKKNLVLCESSRCYLQQNFGVAAEKIPNYIEKSLLLETPKHINSKIERVFFVGRVEEAKGAAEIYTIARRHPDICFELAGETSETVDQWEKPENVKLIGRLSHEQVVEHLDRADIFLLPSHSEGFSVALLESMARGVPAIATDVGAAADMLADGCGIVVQKGDVDAIEQAICALKTEEARKHASDLSRAKAETAYTEDVFMDRIKSIYESVLQ